MTTFREFLELAYRGLSETNEYTPAQKNKIADDLWEFHKTWGDYIENDTPLESLDIKLIPEVEEPDWTELMVICDNCGHAIHVKREEI